MRRGNPLRPSAGADGNAHCRARGFGYIGLIIMVAIISVSAVGALQLGAVLQRRHAELALLRTGAEFQQALDSYARHTPPGQHRLPRSLDELLRDRRYPAPLRHLRRVYADPMTGKAQWGLLRGALEKDGIAGVYSLAPGRPIKVAGFDEALRHLEARTSYRDWTFMSKEEGEAAPPAAGGGMDFVSAQ